jgi:hypothetical protein
LRSSTFHQGAEQIVLVCSAVLRRLVRHNDRAQSGEHSADAVAERDLGAGDLDGDRIVPERNKRSACILYVMPFFGLDLLDMARDVAAFNTPARVGQLFGVSL